MKRRAPLYLVLFPVALLGLALLVGCGGLNPSVAQFMNQFPPATAFGQASPGQLYREVNMNSMLIKRGTAGRKTLRPMNPRYITIHSTQNTSEGANAFQHGRALLNGALRSGMRPGGNRIGYLTWHFTVQDSAVVQHLPIHEQGEHADYDGPGNNYSIGIEMCENRGNNRVATIERTAKLTAMLCYTQGIPVSNVVPHYHWPRYGASPLHKNCPHFLLDNGRPGATWRWFLGRVQMHYNRLVPGPQIRV
jgi:N-acetylmuramoyl-L-alanine amidase